MLKKSVSVKPELPSNQKFGGFFTLVCTIVAAYAYWKSWGTITLVALALVVLFAVATFFSPSILAPLNRLWHGLGIILGKIVSPIVLGVIFFVLITPVSLMTRLFGRDELKLKKRSVESYWVERSPPGPASDSFKNQY